MVPGMTQLELAAPSEGPVKVPWDVLYVVTGLQETAPKYVGYRLAVARKVKKENPGTLILEWREAKEVK